MFTSDKEKLKMSQGYIFGEHCICVLTFLVKYTVYLIDLKIWNNIEMHILDLKSSVN